MVRRSHGVFAYKIARRLLLCLFVGHGEFYQANHRNMKLQFVTIKYVDLSVDQLPPLLDYCHARTMAHESKEFSL
jgi:hypothetical protein